MTEKIIRKTFELKAADLQENTLRGIPSVMGVLDRGMDCIYPGAFSAKVLSDFLKNGFVPIGHEWDDMPVAMPTSIQATGNQLIAECVFHSTERAQECRVICQERLEKGLSVGLSVGFMPDYSVVKTFNNGQEMMAHAAEYGCETKHFDPSMSKMKTYCRGIPSILELFEFSIVPVPANPRAQAIAVKGQDEIETIRDLEKLLRDAGFSKKQACAVASHGFAGLRRDAENSGETVQHIEETVLATIPSSVVAQILKSRHRDLLRHIGAN